MVIGKEIIWFYCFYICVCLCYYVFFDFEFYLFKFVVLVNDYYYFRKLNGGYKNID